MGTGPTVPVISVNTGLLLKMCVVALHAAFDQYLEEPVVALLQDWITS